VVYEITRKIMVEPDKPQMTKQYGACALHAGKRKARIQTHTHTHTPRICNTVIPRLTKIIR